MAADTNGELVVGGMGLACSLGVGAAGAYAAARAGISRARELEYSVVNEDNRDSEFVIGHPIPGLTHGFEGDARLLRIAQLAYADLLGTVDQARIRSGRCGLILVLPERRGATGGPDGSSADAESTRLGAIRWEDAEFVRRFLALTGCDVSASDAYVIRSGGAGIARAIEASMRAAASERRENWLLGAVDSMIDPETLQSLRRDGRLKSADTPAGMQPGEAGLFLLLRPADDARADAASVRVLIRAAASVMRQRSGEAVRHSAGTGLAQATRSLIDRIPTPTDGVFVYVDLNGENSRAAEWGHALPRLLGDAPWLAQSPLRFPAVALGDVGAASGAVALGLAVHELSRSRSGAHSALVLAMSDTGEQAAVCVRSDHG